MVIIGQKYESKHKKLKNTKQIKHLMISNNHRFLRQVYILQDVSLECDI